MLISKSYFLTDDITQDELSAFTKLFKKFNLTLHQADTERAIPISVSAVSKQALEAQNRSYIDWSLLYQTKVGDHLNLESLLERLEQRLQILVSLPQLSLPPSTEQHASIRVTNLSQSTAFYAWLFQLHPKEWTHRYAIFQCSGFNFVLVVADKMTLHQDTLYHLGRMVSSKNEVIQFEKMARERGVHIEKSARTTWMGTPLHELWLRDPDGNLIEVYARLTKEEWAQRPTDLTPILLT